MRKRVVAACAPLLAACLAVEGCQDNNGLPSGVKSSRTIITIDTLTRYQTMTGWEAVAEAGHEEPRFPEWRDQLVSMAVDDLGINRLRLHVRSGSENRTDYHLRALAGESPDPRCERWRTVNDNADPRSIDPAGFHFSRIDSVMSKVVLPIRQRLQARGERLFLNLNYVAFLAQCTTMDFDYVHDDPAEYAELILATFLHLRNRYGIVPDALEIILEPDNVSAWNPVLVGKAMVSAAARLAEHGFRPAFIAPSNASMANAVSWSRELLRVPGVPDLISEIAYHRYGGVSMSNLRALAALANAHGATTAMLEHIGSGADDLYADLTAGGASSWQQFTLAYPTSDNGAQYYRIVDARPVMGSRTRYLRQYFRYVRLGSQRIAAISDRDDVRTVAFLNMPGGVAVVVHAPRAGTIEVRGLPPGTYGASVTTEELTGSELPEQSSTNGVLTVDAPARGILTVYRR